MAFGFRPRRRKTGFGVGFSTMAGCAERGGRRERRRRTESLFERLMVQVGTGDGGRGGGGGGKRGGVQIDSQENNGRQGRAKEAESTRRLNGMEVGVLGRREWGTVQQHQVMYNGQLVTRGLARAIDKRRGRYRRLCGDQSNGGANLSWGMTASPWRSEKRSIRQSRGHCCPQPKYAKVGSRARREPSLGSRLRADAYFHCVYVTAL